MTVYPPGFAPYARVALAPVDLEGRALAETASEPGEAGDHGCWPESDSDAAGKTELWKSTLASGAVDAAQGQAWIREPIDGDPPGPRYATQGRWLQTMALLLGLSPMLGERAVEMMLEHLGFGGLKHRVRRAAFAVATTLRRRGQVMMEALEEVVIDDGLWMRLLAAGHVAGLWGQPRWWVASIGQEVSVLSRVGRSLRGSG